jgi:hypothetical protein
MVIFVTVSCADGDNGAAVCPVGCSCSTVDGYVNNRAVKCSYLGLSDIPAMLNSSKVHSLDLSKNELSILKNASFSSYSYLFTLILSYSKVEEIEINAFAGLHMVRDIDLSYNKLQTFNPKIFSSNPVLDKVYMRGNNLVHLSSELPILISTSISSLDLSFCSLTSLHPVTFSGLPGLYNLDLSSNKLQTISLRTLEQVPDLMVLELNNNPWRCNCDIVEVMQWAESRREQQRAHKPVKCLEGHQYRTLWTMAGGNRSCSESKTTEPDREFTTDMTVDLPITSKGIAPPLKASPSTTTQRVIETTVTSEAELGPAPECERVISASLLSWNVNTLTVFVILPITLGVAVFVSLKTVHYVTKRCRINHPQHHKQEKSNHVAAFSSTAPLLKIQPTTELTKSQAGYENRNSDGHTGAEYHVYEEID